jgi:hypothetical protein
MAENEACEDCGAPADVVTCEVSEMQGSWSGETFKVRVPGPMRALCRACEARRYGQAGRRHQVRNTIRRDT